jgi:hypothetical protein
VRAVRAKIAEVRAEYDGPRLTIDAPVAPTKPPMPWRLRTSDEILAEMIADRDAAIARAAEAQAKVERLEAAYELDSRVREWRKRAPRIEGSTVQ